MATLMQLAAATQKARKASGVAVCTRAEQGRLQVGYYLGTEFVELSGWVSLPVAVQCLLDIVRDNGFR